LEAVNPFDDFTDEELDQLAAYQESIRDEADAPHESPHLPN
jgi:hypothetical protein